MQYTVAVVEEVERSGMMASNENEVVETEAEVHDNKNEEEQPAANNWQENFLRKFLRTC